MVQLRLYTYDTKGNEIKTLFSFDPLRSTRPRDYDRESTRSATRKMRRRPYARQDTRVFTLRAGFLLVEANKRNLERLYDSHKIEWLRLVGGKETWVEYDIDIEGKIEPDHVEDLDPLERHTFTLVQSDAVWFTDFENKDKELKDVS